ncbi:reverse transcriptase domain-containing protein [Tanacetum coccineum]
MNTCSTSDELVSPFSNPERIVRNRQRNLLLDFEEVNMADNHQGPPLVGPIPPLLKIMVHLRWAELLPHDMTIHGCGFLEFVIHMISTVQILANFTDYRVMMQIDILTNFWILSCVIDLISNTPRILIPLRPILGVLHHATAWYDRLLRNSIHSFEDMMRKFLSKYFPPSMVTKLRNEITKFRQDPNESLFEAWERYQLSIDRCPNYNMHLVTQIDTFYNGLTLRHQDTINADTSAERGESTRSTTSSSPEIADLTKKIDDLSTVILRMSQSNPQVNVVNQSCETCGGPHRYTECQATGSHTQDVYVVQGDRNLLSYRSNNYLGPGYQAPLNQTQVVPSNDLSNYMKVNEANMRAMQNQITTMRAELKNEMNNTVNNQHIKLESLSNSFVQKLNPLGLGSLPSNTVANPRGDLKAITTRSGVAYEGPSNLPTSSPLPKEVEREPEVTKDKVQSTSSESTAHVQPPVVQVPISEPEVSPKPNSKPSIPYPSRLNDQKLRDKANNQMLKFIQIFQRLHFDISFVDALLHMPKFASTYKSLLTNKDK